MLINFLLSNSASEFQREYDGACLQMRMSYCPAAHFFLFLVQWTDCSLAGALGLLRILIYKVDWHSFPKTRFLSAIFLMVELGLCFNINIILLCRFMLMEQQPCLLMKGKQASESSMV
jgi:hypothetical protein